MYQKSQEQGSGKDWFIDRDRVYKMIKALSGYSDGTHGRIEVTDDSGSDEG